MKWEKHGLIIEPGKFGWMMTHAQNPFPAHIEGNIYRIYFAGRDRLNMARGGFADVDLSDPKRILAMPDKPVLDLGELGCFDDCGVMPSCIVKHDDLLYMYYTGWTQARATPFSFFIGLAVSRGHGQDFERVSRAPILGRTRSDPFVTASPWVVMENGVWRMWYVSGTRWEIKPRRPVPMHYYHIRYAESSNGVDWKTEGTVCIDFREGEYAIARPVVYRDSTGYKMWYCYRGGTDTYRAGYAESRDGIAWDRKDGEVGIDVCSSGWDSDMICYPCVFSHGGRQFMLYNGNSYGATGAGLAVQVGDVLKPAHPEKDTARA